MSFGEIIRSSRRRLNWTQDELAAKLSCKKTAVSKWEANKSVPPLPRLIGLAEVLGILPDVLFESVGSTNKHSTREGANIDPLLLTAWHKLTPKQRNIVVQIAVILSEE
jgi:transcriptional regulator with XRE-family HTH domain